MTIRCACRTVILALLLVLSAYAGEKERDAFSKRSAHGVTPLPEGRTPATIDHERPDQYAKLAKSAGDPKLIRKLAKDLRAEDPEHTLLGIHAFIRDKIPNVPGQGWAADHKDFDLLVKGFDHNGCASHGLVFANLARACGIPCVYVKSNRHSWIREFVASGKRGGFSGHVFLEVFLGERWKLLCAQSLTLWDPYDPGDPELPGGLLAYEKGWDHVAMVHSTQRDRYIAESLARWKGFDVSRLRENKAPGRSLHPVVYAITVSDEWKELSSRVKTRMCFDRHHWPQYREKVKGTIFIVTAVGGKTDLPPEEAGAWLPVSLDELAEEARQGKSGVRMRRLDDGTRVLLLSAPGKIEIRKLIWATDLAVRVAELAVEKE